MKVQGVLIVPLKNKTCVRKEFKISVYPATELNSS